MKANKFQSVRHDIGVTGYDMAKALGLKIDAYYRRERGEVAFSPDEITKMSEALDLTSEQINDLFFDGKLPIG